MSDNEARESDHCGRGICSAEDGHAGTCAAASGWDEAGRAEPLTVDREGLIRVISDDILNVDDGAGSDLDTSVRDSEYPRDYLRVRGALDISALASTVIAHLSAQEAATEVEWASGFAGEVASVGPVLTEATARRQVAEWATKFPSDNATVYRRTVTPWQEVPADEHTAS